MPGLRPAAHLLSLLAKKGGKETSPGYRALLRKVPCVPRVKWRQGKLAALKHALPCFHWPLRYSARPNRAESQKQWQQQNQPSFCASAA
ncbi:hypothetical protein CO610_03335 [Lysobacteraceae bacterium NML95-0200]|nr:hypothetical protein CO610_03335 [Xanthomonadaceae bacterium NML95-0200]